MPVERPLTGCPHFQQGECAWDREPCHLWNPYRPITGPVVVVDCGDFAVATGDLVRGPLHFIPQASFHRNRGPAEATTTHSEPRVQWTRTWVVEGVDWGRGESRKLCKITPRVVSCTVE